MGALLIFFSGTLIFLLWPHRQGPITNEDWTKYHQDIYNKKVIDWGKDHHRTHKAYETYKASVPVFTGG